MRVSPSRFRRRRVGRVTVYQRGSRPWVYYRQGGEVIRRAVGADRAKALSLAARINAELAEGAPTSLAFRPVEITGVIAKRVDHHEQVRRSSVATIRRYRTEIQHFDDFVKARYGKLRADRFTAGMLVDHQACDETVHSSRHFAGSRPSIFPTNEGLGAREDFTSLPSFVIFRRTQSRR